MGESTDAEKPLVMVIDDDAAVRDAIALWLRPFGFAVLLVGSAEEAIALLQETVPDVIVADWQLPGMDGLTAINAARNIDRHVQTFLMSAYPPPLQEPGSVRFFAKPHEIPALLDLIVAGQE